MVVKTNHVRGDEIEFFSEIGEGNEFLDAPNDAIHPEQGNRLIKHRHVVDIEADSVVPEQFADVEKISAARPDIEHAPAPADIKLEIANALQVGFDPGRKVEILRRRIARILDVKTFSYFFELLVIDRFDNRVCIEVARHAFFQSKTAQAVTSTLEGGAIQQFSDLVRKFTGERESTCRCCQPQWRACSFDIIISVVELRMNIWRKLLWIAVAAIGALSVAVLAMSRGEPISALWIIVAGLCTLAISYRFYSKWLATKVLVLNDERATPAVVQDDGKDFVPTNRWMAFGHHFAAIAGPGPLVGPVLAAQFGFLPGTLWILIGATLGGGVHDMIVLFASVRRGGKTLGQMVKEEIGSGVGALALVSVLAIMIILLAVLALVVVQALAKSPWGVFTIATTIPVALIMGIGIAHRPSQRRLDHDLWFGRSGFSASGADNFCPTFRRSRAGSGTTKNGSPGR